MERELGDQEYEVEARVNARSPFLAWICAVERARESKTPRGPRRPAAPERARQSEELAGRMILGLVADASALSQNEEHIEGEARGYRVVVTMTERACVSPADGGATVARAAATVKVERAEGVFEDPDVWGCGPFELAGLKAEVRAALERQELERRVEEPGVKSGPKSV